MGVETVRPILLDITMDGKGSITFILALEGDGSILRTPKLSVSILVLEDGFGPTVMVLGKVASLPFA